MAPSAKKRSVVSEKYGGVSQGLPETDLPTYKDVARYFYFVSLKEKDYNSQIRITEEKVTPVWAKCRLPLIDKVPLRNKLKRFFDKVKNYDQKIMKPAARKVFDAKREKLFDIAACSCELPILPCASRSIRCAVSYCKLQHIACDCQKRVPVEEENI